MTSGGLQLLFDSVITCFIKVKWIIDRCFREREKVEMKVLKKSLVI